MPDLKLCFEGAGFTNVKTVLSSGNVVFDSRSSADAALEQRAEAQMQARLGRIFVTFVRRTKFLRELLEADPYARFVLAPDSKRVVSFLRKNVTSAPPLPLELGRARILDVVQREVFAAYTPSDNGPEFMRLIEGTFGREITTRTWETVRKCVAA
jgi:uncharacterized protein (DUF1697 family)